MDNLNKKIIGAVIVVVLVLGAGIVWWQYKGGGSKQDVQVGSSKEIETNLNTDFLDSDMVNNLKRHYTNFPIEIPEKGRDNPFNPY